MLRLPLQAAPPLPGRFLRCQACATSVKYANDALLESRAGAQRESGSLCLEYCDGQQLWRQLIFSLSKSLLSARAFGRSRNWSGHRSS